MISILFVDDEVNILEGIRNSLRKRLSEWNLAFAQSGQEALKILSESRFDIVVSDMRMPGMDGAALLTEIQDKYPHMTRFILTGQADRESILRAIPVTHQFLYKPCSPVDLLALLDRTCNLQDRIQNNDIRRLVNAAKCVPSAPKTAAKIAELSVGGQPSLREIAAVIERDPGLSARILQVSNSAVMGRSKEVTSISDAVTCVGLEGVQALAIANDVFKVTPENRSFKVLIDQVNDRSFFGATLAAQFLTGTTESGTAMTSALLRDIGLLVTAISQLPIYNIATDAQASSGDLIEVELKRLGVTHAEVGGHLLALWGTPMTVVEAVTCHHSVEDSTIDPFIMAAVHVADVIAGNRQLAPDALEAKLNWDYIETNQLESEVREWLKTDFDSLQTAA